ncbi:alpha/beta fold hydrolase [Rhodococcus erythropolis]|uniref:alpha/beta fold hydrolase n=1 Tax=Rhodococcus erythropolis TaxID=1833 RepID=UPI001BE604E3|nr:alpha/beta fold hydrolase [Rhodococcus erythropolis]MBT2266808.1 alpha/beta fold hydrolase [Rhodococcus erythropolis]
MSPRNIVLIHGAWAGGWVWDRVRGPLKSAGFDPVVVELPGSGSWNPDDVIDLAAVAEHVVSVMESFDGPAILVGHSGGGIVASQVAEWIPSQVTGLVYVAGMMLPSQMDFGMLCAEAGLESPVGISRWLVPVGEGEATAVPPEAAAAVFFHEAPVADAIGAARMLVPQLESARLMAADWTEERFGTVPRLYVECTLDRTVPIEAQRAMQRLVPGAQVVSLGTDHAPQLSALPELIDAITDFAQQVFSRTRPLEPAATGPRS